MTISFEELKYYNDVEPLNNTNCYDWSYAWKIVLIRMQLWGIVSGNKPKPLIFLNYIIIKVWIRKDEKVQARIVRNIDKP